MEFPDPNKIISFNSETDPSISYYETINWPLNTFYQVEFFTDKFVMIYLISNENPNLQEFLQKIEPQHDDFTTTHQNKIAIDLEWEFETISLIQFCANKICLVIRIFQDSQNNLMDSYHDLETIIKRNKLILKEFIINHQFYGKGMHNDKKMLMKYFGTDFSMNLEDIARTRLIPYGNSENFNQMTFQFVGKPKADFKVINMTKSHWDAPELCFRQVLYAAFDVAALFYCYPNFPPPLQLEKSNLKQKQKSKSTRQHHNVKYNKQSIEQTEKSPSNEIIDTKRKKIKMNLSVVFKKKEKKQTYSYLICNYSGTKNRVELRKLYQNLDFISSYETNSESYLFVSSFLPIFDFSQFSFDSNIAVTDQIEIQVSSPDQCFCNAGIRKIIENVYLLPVVPNEMCFESDVLFIKNIHPSIFDDEKLFDLFYCFGFDQLVSKLDFKETNSCRVEPRNIEISKRIRTFIPFLTFGDMPLLLFDYPSFLNTVRISNLPSYFSEADFKSLLISNSENDESIIKSCEFILRRIETDNQTAFVTFNDHEIKDFCIQQFNHYVIDDNELLVIPFTDDVHLRYLRTYEIIFTPSKRSTTNLQDIYQQFGQFGQLLQVGFNRKINNYQIQFYRKCDALAAYQSLHDIYKNNLEMHPDGSTAIVRDLPMSVTEDELLSLFGSIGRITNLIFRDLTPMNILSVADIFYADPQEAKEAKKRMNKTKLKDTFIHVSIRSKEDICDWKMSQRNQWVVFDNNVQTIEQINEMTKKIGRIIDYNYSNNRYLVMFDNPDNAKLVVDSLNLTFPTYQEFVGETNNADELEIIQKPSIPGNPTGPKESVLVIDPVPDTLTIDFIEKVFAEGNLQSDEVTSIVLASSLRLPPVTPKLSANSNEEKKTSECADPHETFISDSIQYPGQKRLIVYTPSNKVTKKLYTLLVNSEFEGKYLKPKKVDLDDLQNPPPKKKHAIIFEGREITGPVIAIDPLPPMFHEKEIRDAIKELASFEMVICPSAIIKGELRAVILPRGPDERRIILKALSQKIINDKYLHVFKYKSAFIPQSL